VLQKASIVLRQGFEDGRRVLMRALAKSAQQALHLPRRAMPFRQQIERADDRAWPVGEGKQLNPAHQFAAVGLQPQGCFAAASSSSFNPASRISAGSTSPARAAAANSSCLDA
jgi:hypothetical protein